MAQITPTKTIYRLGFYSALISLVATISYSTVQLLQVMGILKYPTDAILIYGFSLCIAAPYLIAIIVFHECIDAQRKLWANIAGAFAIMYTTFVTLMYTVQLASVIPQSLHDPAETILAVTPHSFFWTLDALGYICLGISTLFAAFGFPERKSYRWPRIFLIANGLMVPIIGFVYFYPNFSVALLILGSPWVVTATGSFISLAIYFRRNLHMIKKAESGAEKLSIVSLV